MGSEAALPEHPQNRRTTRRTTRHARFARVSSITTHARAQCPAPCQRVVLATHPTQFCKVTVHGELQPHARRAGWCGCQQTPVLSFIADFASPTPRAARQAQRFATVHAATVPEPDEAEQPARWPMATVAAGLVF